MMIICLLLKGVAILIMSIALRNVSEMEKVANAERNYPKMVEYHRTANILVVCIITVAVILALEMVGYSYNFYHQ